MSHFYGYWHITFEELDNVNSRHSKSHIDPGISLIAYGGDERNRGRNCVLSDDEKLIKPWVRSEHAKDEGWVDWTGKPPLFKNAMITQKERIVIGGVEAGMIVLNVFLE